MELDALHYSSSRLTSPHLGLQYLEMRYGSLATRRVASALFIIQILLNQAVVIYAPALALAAVTDFPIWVSILTVGAIASVYTAIVSSASIT